MFLVESKSPLDEQWEERDKTLFDIAGRASDCNQAGCENGEGWRIHEWFVEDFDKALVLRMLLQTVEFARVTIREHVTATY